MDLMYNFLMYIVYVIQNSTSKEVYIGKTNNLKRRLKQHNSNVRDKRFTNRKAGEWITIYAEAYRNKDDASRREIKLKQRGSAKYGLMKRIQKSLLEN